MNHLRESVMCANEPCTMPAPQESLTERMNATADLGVRVLTMAEAIRNNLFGMRCPKAGEARPDAPCCMEERLELHRACLVQTAQVLEEICARLGV